LKSRRQFIRWLNKNLFLEINIFKPFDFLELEKLNQKKDALNFDQTISQQNHHAHLRNKKIVEYQKCRHFLQVIEDLEKKIIN